MSEAKQVAIVTGGSRGIGRGIALALAKEGLALVVNYASNATAAEETRRDITAFGSPCHLVQGDVANPSDRHKIIDETLTAFGRLDILVNNAGIAPLVRADILDADEASFDRLISVNLKGPYFLTQIAARKMIELLGQQRITHPKIITITSVSAFAPSVNRGDYCVAKAGLAMMTQLYASRLAEHGINVYEIRPGIIATDMTGPVKEKYDKLIFQENLTPLSRWGHPDDVARAVVAIARDLLPFSTGEVINVDGGFHMRRL